MSRVWFLIQGLLLTSGWVAVQGESPQPSEQRLRTSPVLQHLVPNPLRPSGGPSAETLARMHVTPGFQVEGVAAEPDVRQPVAFAFDARGRLWVAEAYSYPTRQPVGKGRDRLIILADTDGDGRFEKRTVFAEGLNLVSGFEVGFGGVWVGAAPELLFIPDADGDDRPDAPPRVLLEGFGYQDTHECLNSFHWGPDGWLYGIQGVFNLAHIGKPGAPDSERTELRAGVWRYHPMRHVFEVFAHGGSNPWGLDHDAHGELFMTHCRSYWGRGCTTHVVQGGHFWNQANAHYAPFIVADPPQDFPEFRNYLLASARYDHGAGGAGVAGSDAIYGGHSHVGTLLYQGDNWPAEYRGHLFTHNLHGHQINHQVNRPMGSGYDTTHAGRDLLFCTDPRYVPVDLQTGPDGAVYVIDWYDAQHCHNPNDSRWERGDGRIYRIAWAATYKPVKCDLGSMPDAELVGLMGHPNAWWERTARRVLQERAATGRLKSTTLPLIVEKLAGPDPSQRLRVLWTLHAVGALDEAMALRALKDQDEHVRSWTVQLACERGDASPALSNRLIELAAGDPSPIVRRRLASAAQRLPTETALALYARLVKHAEDVDDRHLPMLVWQGLAQRVSTDSKAAMAIARTAAWPLFIEWAAWYAAVNSDAGVETTVQDLPTLDPATRHRRMAGLWLAVQQKATVARPGGWNAVARMLDADPDRRVRHLADRLAGAFGDASRFPALRTLLADPRTDLAERRHALEVLARSPDTESLPTFIGLLDDDALREAVLPVLARHDSPMVPDALLSRFPKWTPALQRQVLGTLVRRRSSVLPLLDALEAGQIPRSQLSAFHIRQIATLKDPAIDARIAKGWGRMESGTGGHATEINAMEKTFSEAPLWAYDAKAGREHFKRLCASCHVLGGDGQRIGPELTGAGRNGIRYLAENILDPNAVVGADFEATDFALADGDTVSGLVVSETAEAVTLRTVVEQRTLAKKDIRRRERSGRSLMPEGLMESLAPRERLELLKFLSEN